MWPAEPPPRPAYYAAADARADDEDEDVCAPPSDEQELEAGEIAEARTTQALRLQRERGAARRTAQAEAGAALLRAWPRPWGWPRPWPLRLGEAGSFF